jgi:hypothetical protein
MRPPLNYIAFAAFTADLLGAQVDRTAIERLSVSCSGEVADDVIMKLEDAGYRIIASRFFGGSGESVMTMTAEREIDV